MGRRRKTIAVIFIVAVLLSSGVLMFTLYGDLNQSPKKVAVTNSSNPPQQYFGFSFPYTYQQPENPPNVGVQGISGPQVPISQLGPQGQVGPTGHLGPSSVSSNPESIASQSSSVSVRVYTGTFSPLSRSPASGAQVAFQNISSTSEFTVPTNSEGYANFSIPQGWYMLSIAGSGSTTGFSQQIDLIGSNVNLVRYLLPSGTGGNGVVNNGPSGSAITVAFHVYYSTGFNAPQLTVSLYNQSSGGNLLAQEITNFYGYANFTGVSNAFTYSYKVDGNSQPATGVFTGGANVSGSFNPISGGTQSLSVQVAGLTSWTASVQGTAPSQGYVSSIVLSGPVTFTGGSVHLSAPFSNANHAIHFVSTTVYFNSSTYGNWPNMYFDNSTVIIQTPVEPFGTVGQSTLGAGFNNSRIFFSAIVSTAPEVSQQGGIWLAGNSYNSVFVAPQIYSGLVHSTLTGRFVNSEFYDFNMTQSITQNPNPVGTVHLNHDSFVNSTVSWNTAYIENSILSRFSLPNIASYMSVNNSYMNVTMWGWQQTLTFGQTSSYNHDFITAVDTLQDVNFGNTFTNYSYCYLNFTPKSASTPTYPSLYLAGNRISFYNDFIINYPTDAVRWAIVQKATGGYQGFGMTIGPHYLEMNYTALYGMDGIGFFPPHYFWYNFSHVNFSNGWSDQEWNPFEWFAGVVQPAIPTGTFNNCTFYGMHYNSSIWWRQFNLSTDNPIGFWQDLNVPNPPTSMWGRIYINFTTAYNIGVGTTDAYAFGISEGGIYSYLNNNLFLNRADGVFTPFGTSKWINGSYQQYPIGTSVQHAAGNIYLSNNWFLNLNNKTVPIQSIVGSGGQGSNALISFGSGNHFYYYPTKLQSYIPVYTTPPAVPFDNNSNQWYLFPVNPQARATAPMYANYTFEIPVGGHGQLLTSPNQDQYIFNSTVRQPNIFGPSSPLLTQAWVIEPDVNTSTGRPVVNFQNGLVGGIMPNFTWNGSGYQLAVEPNMTYIKASAQSASPVDLQFQVPVGLADFNLWVYNSSSGKIQLLQTVAESGSASTVTVTYNPSSMPLGAVFFGNTTSRYSVTFSQEGLPQGASWTVSLGGIASTARTGNITFNLKNGSYQFNVTPKYGYSVTPESGNITINGSDVVVNVTWKQSSYPVNFKQDGLSGGNWSVELGGSLVSSSTDTASFSEPNGTYSFSISGPSNYSASVSTGNVTVNGTAVVVMISFIPLNNSVIATTNYTVTFNVSGLSGESWKVALGGNLTETNSSTASFSEPNGTYSFSISGPSNYSASVSTGNVTVNGTAVVVMISFIPLNNSGTTTIVPPPPTSSPPKSPPSSPGQSIYNNLIIDILAISLAPGIVLTAYFGIYFIRTDSDKRKQRPK